MTPKPPCPYPETYRESGCEKDIPNPLHDAWQAGYAKAGADVVALKDLLDPALQALKNAVVVVGRPNLHAHTISQLEAALKRAE